MNPQDGFRRLQDPENWTFRLGERNALVPRKRAWSALVVSLSTVAAVAVAGIVVLSVFGLCVRGIHDPAAPPLPPSSNRPSSTPAPTPTPGSIGDADCSNLLDKSTRAEFKTDGATSAREGWDGRPPASAPNAPFKQDAVFSISDGSVLGLQAFTKRGGIACNWSIDGASDLPTYFAYGPISSADAVVAKAALARDGEQVVSNGIARYVTFRPDSNEPSGSLYTGDFAFSTDGYWAFGYSPGFTTDVLAEVLQNAPSFQHTLVANTGPMLAADNRVNCANLLDTSTVFALKDMDYVPTQKTISPNSGRSESTYIPFGGAVGMYCIWAPRPTVGSGTDASISFGYGPIKASDSVTVQLILTELGATSTTADGITRLTGSQDGREWAFGDGYWATALTNGGPGGIDYLTEVIRNAPAF